MVMASVAFLHLRVIVRHVRLNCSVACTIVGNRRHVMKFARSGLSHTFLKLAREKSVARGLQAASSAQHGLSLVKNKNVFFRFFIVFVFRTARDHFFIVFFWKTEKKR